MRTRLLTVLVAVVAGAGVLAGAAAASGPAAPGKGLVNIDCVGLGPITISISAGQNGTGAGQIVDMKGHGIPVAIITTLTDLTTATVLHTETHQSGHGNGHPNQATTECTGVLFEGSAADFFGAHLPPGVAPTDSIELSLDAFIILQP